MIIATGTGRCGTMTFAQLFGLHHEFGSRILRKSCEWRWDQLGEPYNYANQDNNTRILMAHANEVCEKTGASSVSHGSFSGNSSHFYLPLIDALPSMGGGVKVVYLIRDVFEYCRSMFARGLEKKRGWLYNPSPGDTETYEAWGSWDKLRQAAWIWAFQNRLAHELLLRLPENTYKVVWTHDIYPRSSEIAAFVGRQPHAKMVSVNQISNRGKLVLLLPDKWEDADREKVLPYAQEIARLPLFERK